MARRVLIVLIAALTLAGCTTAATITTVGEVPEGEGLVVMRLTANSFDVGFFKYWNVLKVEEIGGAGAGEFTIGLSRRGSARTAVYLGHLPPGRYRLTTLSSEQCGAICVSSTITVNERFGEFEVEAGRTTDLGHAVYRMRSNRAVEVSRGRSMEVWLPDYVAEYYPNIPVSIVVPPYLGWDDDPLRAEAMQGLYDRARVQTLGQLNPAQTADGDILFGTLLGMVKRWRPGNRIVVHDTGLQGGIESVLEVEPGVWLVGGENGRLRLSRDAGMTWEDFGEGFPYMNIAALHARDGRLYATVSNEDRLEIHETTLDAPTWRRLSAHELEFSFWTGVPIFPQSFLLDDRLVTSLPTNGLLITHLETGEAELKSFPGSIFRFSVGGDGVLRCMCTRALFNNPWKSTDLGDSWTPSDHDRYMWVPHFVDADTGYGLLRERVMRTTDGGATWEDIAEAPKHATRIGHFARTGDLYAIDDHGFYYRSADGGVTWTSN